MSKPFDERFLSPAGTEPVVQKSEVLLQILGFLEILKTNESGKMARISGELTELLADENNLDKVLNAKNLEELLLVLVELDENKMIKVYEKDYLKERFPLLARSRFIK